MYRLISFIGIKEQVESSRKKVVEKRTKNMKLYLF